jgi:hypothetical protein
MLIQDYTYYVFNLLATGAVTPVGLLSLALLVGSVVSLFALRGNHMRSAAFWGLLLVGIACLMTSFYTAVYEFDERPETLTFDSLPAGEPDCGTAWSGWIRTGFGLPNSCPEDCYRGLVLRKQMRMTGFPPWPKYNRESQCWTR